MTDELKQEMTEKFNSAYGEEVKIGLREALRKVYIDGCEHGYQYAVDKVCDILNHYCNRTGVHPSWRVDIINHIRKAMEE